MAAGNAVQKLAGAGRKLDRAKQKAGGIEQELNAAPRHGRREALGHMVESSIFGDTHVIPWRTGSGSQIVPFEREFARSILDEPHDARRSKAVKQTGERCRNGID